MTDVEDRPDAGLASKALFGAGLVAVGIGNYVTNREANRGATSPALEGSDE